MYTLRPFVIAFTLDLTPEVWEHDGYPEVVNNVLIYLGVDFPFVAFFCSGACIIESTISCDLDGSEISLSTLTH